jgi:hypothetical protein
LGDALRFGRGIAKRRFVLCPWNRESLSPPQFMPVEGAVLPWYNAPQVAESGSEFSQSRALMALRLAGAGKGGCRASPENSADIFMASPK